MPPNTLLIDVRSPSEFALGHLTSDLAPTVNIEYQSISTIASVYATHHGIQVHPDDNITLYCRSGRRSDIALKMLKAMGFSDVRDLGSFDDARRTLDKETVERQLERMDDLAPLEGNEGVVPQGGVKDKGVEGLGKDKREKGLVALLEGLKECDG